MQHIFCSLPQICASTRSYLWALQTVRSTSLFACCSDMLSCDTFKKTDVPFLIMSNSLNLTTCVVWSRFRNISKMIRRNGSSSAGFQVSVQRVWILMPMRYWFVDWGVKAAMKQIVKKNWRSVNTFRMDFVSIITELFTCSTLLISIVILILSTKGCCQTKTKTLIEFWHIMQGYIDQYVRPVVDVLGLLGRYVICWGLLSYYYPNIIIDIVVQYCTCVDDIEWFLFLYHWYLVFSMHINGIQCSLNVLISNTSITQWMSVFYQILQTEIIQVKFSITKEGVYVQNIFL